MCVFVGKFKRMRCGGDDCGLRRDKDVYSRQG
jgi:hypothetical protein